MRFTAWKQKLHILAAETNVPVCFCYAQGKAGNYPEELFAPKGKKGRRGMVKSNNYNIR